VGYGIERGRDEGGREGNEKRTEREGRREESERGMRDRDGIGLRERQRKNEWDLRG
jgi:hypothetical protein